jgi:hypothetical protein
MGASIALPLLEAMLPASTQAGSVGGATGQAAATAFPNRVAWVYVPNGKHMPDWTPRLLGREYQLPRILQPLTPHKNKFMVMSGLDARQAEDMGDGGGDHARAQAAYLTGVHPLKTDGSNIRLGISIDQLIASRIGDVTRLRSLEIGADPSNFAGSCDTNYSCAYISNLSWRSSTQPQPKTNNPRVVFQRLFGNGNRQEQNRIRTSILDVVADDASALERALGSSDRRKLDEYLTSVRDIEQRIQRAERLPPTQAPVMRQPEGIPASYEEHLRLLSDLLVLAFQADITRICTYVLANESSNRPYPWIGVSEGHHDLSHHQNNAAKQAKIRDINVFHVTQFAYLLNRLDSINEGNGTLLDHCLITYGSGCADGDRHNHDDLPTLLAGGGSGMVTTGRHARWPRGTPIANLWIAMADRMGVRLERFGDSTRRLTRLDE